MEVSFPSTWRSFAKLDIALVVTADSVFSGITTFAKLPWVQCLGKDKDVTFDVAFIGAPFVHIISSLSSAAVHENV